MNYVGKNEELLKRLVTDLTLIDGEINSIRIFNNDENTLAVEILVKLRSKKTLRLIFKDIVEYSFYHNDSHYFYNIERFKLFQQGESIYVSFDPCDESSEISINDQDFIKCNDIEGYIA